MTTYTTIKRFEGTSGATKPTSDLLKIGDVYIETDTLLKFEWNGTTWKQTGDLNTST